MGIVVGRVCSHIRAGARKLLVHQVEKYSWDFSLGSKNNSVVADGILHLRSATLLDSIYHYPLRSAFWKYTYQEHEFLRVSTLYTYSPYLLRIVYSVSQEECAKLRESVP